MEGGCRRPRGRPSPRTTDSWSCPPTCRPPSRPLISRCPFRRVRRWRSRPSPSSPCADRADAAENPPHTYVMEIVLRMTRARGLTTLVILHDLNIAARCVRGRSGVVPSSRRPIDCHTASRAGNSREVRSYRGPLGGPSARLAVGSLAISPRRVAAAAPLVPDVWWIALWIKSTRRRGMRSRRNPERGPDGTAL